jgi:hypothetical protein
MMFCLPLFIWSDHHYLFNQDTILFQFELSVLIIVGFYILIVIFPLYLVYIPLASVLTVLDLSNPALSRIIFASGLFNIPFIDNIPVLDPVPLELSYNGPKIILCIDNQLTKDLSNIPQNI